MRLTQTDASFLYMESASGPMHISSVYVLEGELDFNKLIVRFEKRLHLVPAYRKKLQQVPFSLAHPIWTDDPEFDLNNHVVHHELPPDTSLEDGIDIAVGLNEQMLDRSIPLWKTVMLSGVPGKTLLLQMTHHAMIDGASGIDLTMIIYDLDPNAEEPVPPNEPWSAEHTQNPAELVAGAFQENIQQFTENNPMQLASRISSNSEKLTKAGEIFSRFAMQPAITAPFNAGVVGPHRKVRYLKKPFSELRDIRKQLGGTINDVVLTVLSEAVSRYVLSKDSNAKGQFLRIMCPVNVRTEDQQGALGNQVSGIFPRLPVEAMDILQRHHVVMAETERIKRDEEAQALTVMQECMPYMPPVGMMASQLIGTPMDPTAMAARVPMPIMPSFGGMRPPNVGYNFVCTNVPGVQVPQYMCGHEVTDTIGLLVLTGNVGLSVTVVSYNRQLFLNFICEPRLLPDLEVLTELTDDVYGELLNLAQAHEAERRRNDA